MTCPYCGKTEDTPCKDNFGNEFCLEGWKRAKARSIEIEKETVEKAKKLMEQVTLEHVVVHSDKNPI